MRPPATETITRLVDPVAVEALGVLLGAHDVDPSRGAPLPALWHWAALSRWPDPGLLGPDGHPRRGTGVMPEVDLPRRMFGGGTVTIHAPVPIGSDVTVTSTASTPRSRTGSSGRLVLVDLSVEIRSLDGTLLVEEVQNLVYTEGRGVDGEPPEPVALPLGGTLLTPVEEASDSTSGRSWSLHTDPTLLARFSALTCNPHRIHLDWPYATRVEGYPGLVVHGPLLAIALTEVARRVGAARPARLRHRGTAPLFCGEPAELVLVAAEPTVAEVRSGRDPSRVHSRLELDPRPQKP